MNGLKTNTAVVLIFMLLPEGPTRAESPTGLELAQWARTFKSAYPIASSSDVAAARAAVIESVDRLDAFLPAGDRNTAAWKEYLQWQTLENQLSLETGADVDALRAVYARFTSNQPGLEKPAFMQAASALQRYIDLLGFATMPDTAERHRDQIARLATSLEAYADAPTEQRALVIGQAIEWLEASGHAAELTNAVRARFSHPNLCVDASARLFSLGFAQPIDVREPVADNILGVSISGTGHTRADVEVRLVPDPQRATAMIVARGTTEANTVGRKGPITVTGDVLTTFIACKTLHVDEHGVSSHPARCQAWSNGRPQCVCGAPLMRRLAWIRLRRQQAEANRIAACHAEKKISRRVDRTGVEKIQHANDTYLSRFRQPLLRQRQFPARLDFSTTSESLRVVGLQAGRGQLGAPGPPPGTLPARDLVARLHESVFNNVSSAMLADRTMTDEDLRTDFPEFLQPFVKRLAPTESEKPLSVTFDSDQPISVKFAENRFHVTIRGRRWTSGRRKFGAMNVSASYLVQSGPDESQLRREGELKIVPPGFVSGKDRLNFREIALRRVLARKFGRLFEPLISLKVKTLPEPWSQAGKLRVQDIDSESGWLRIAWVLTASKND